MRFITKPCMLLVVTLLIVAYVGGVFTINVNIKAFKSFITQSLFILFVSPIVTYIYTQIKYTETKGK
ncbi:hypothetical protein [Clostridium estertheticum]|uniref:hypothetical protein n=1 Tax=Clostridium estertheticum TaxID=238834 RepID=UPI001C7D3A30|nr:hypothetical protein [Clostridium estertheticum]MBX4272123.1 hypothetical protein [Clostridium estertheticum]WLC82498.1 hypothetical protein KTC98_24395 [Clostridium estertheticum]